MLNELNSYYAIKAEKKKRAISLTHFIMQLILYADKETLITFYDLKVFLYCSQGLSIKLGD